MTLAIVIAVAVGSLWLPDVIERLLEERSLEGMEDATRPFKRWTRAGSKWADEGWAKRWRGALEERS